MGVFSGSSKGNSREDGRVASSRIPLTCCDLLGDWVVGITITMVSIAIGTLLRAFGFSLELAVCGCFLTCAPLRVLVRGEIGLALRVGHSPRP